MRNQFPTWHEVEPLEKDWTRFLIVNLEPSQLALPIAEPASFPLSEAHVIFAVSKNGSNFPHEMLEARECGVVIAILRNDIELAKTALTDIVHVFTRESYVGIDFEDFRFIVDCSTKSPIPELVAFSGTARGQNAGLDALKIALTENASIQAIDFKKIGGLLLIISAGQSVFKLDMVKAINQVLSERVSPQALTNFGMNFDESIGDAVRVTIFITL
jgi:hypothetical protein